LGNYAGKYNTASNAFYVDSYDRSTTAGDKAGALLYGLFNSTPSSQTLTLNASTSIAQNLNVHGTGNNYLFGNTGIGTTTPSVKLDVNGLIRVYQTSTTTCSASIEGSIFYNGTVGNKHFYGCDGTNWKQLD
jgi:hypothetical protein